MGERGREKDDDEAESGKEEDKKRRKKCKFMCSTVLTATQSLGYRISPSSFVLQKLTAAEKSTTKISLIKFKIFLNKTATTSGSRLVAGVRFYVILVKDMQINVLINNHESSYWSERRCFLTSLNS